MSGDGAAGAAGAGAADVEARLRSLLRATTGIVGELSLEAVLHRIVEAARDLLGVEYGALGVIAPDRQGLEQFVHAGIDPAAVRRIGHLPRGEGLLGALIEDPRPIRLRRIADDGRSVGFPAGHPPMAAFLGVPVTVRGQVFGNLYLCDGTPRDFDDADVEAVTALAATAGIAVENARLFEESRTRQAWLEHTSRLTRDLVGHPDADALDLVAGAVHELSGGARVAVHGPPGSGRPPATRGSAVLEPDAEQALADWAATSGVPLRRAEDGEPESVARAGAPGDGGLATLPREVPFVVAPLVGPGGRHGSVVLTRGAGERAFTADDVDTVVTFAGHVSLALEVVARGRDRERIALLEERARIARDLHDHVIQQLFAAGMTVQGVAAALDGSPGGAGPSGASVVPQLSRVVDLVDDAVGQIRTSIFQLQGRPQGEGGVRARVLATTAQLRPALGLEPQVRFAGPVDVAIDAELADDLCAVVREALANVARHAGATRATVSVEAGDDELVVVVSDDGAGLPARIQEALDGQGAEGHGGQGGHGGHGGHGLRNLRERADRWGGTLTAQSPSSGTGGGASGTVLTWRVPTR